jgi:L-iditol 2-dehydrogenase
LTSCRAVVFPAPEKPPEIRDIPVPELVPGAVVLRTIASEVCGTDVHLFHGRLDGVPYPLIPGHISVGQIEDTDGDLADAEGNPVGIGDTVVFYDVIRTCGACYACTVALTPTRCPQRRVYGITLPADRPHGGWSTHIYLEPGTKLLKLPDGVATSDYMGGGCGLHTGYRAVERADVQVGSSVLVMGSGPVGLAATAFARLAGAGKVLVTGAPEMRLAAAREMEADDTMDISGTGRPERVAWSRDLTEGRGPDIVIEAAGAPEAAVEAMEIVREGGTVVIAGQYTDAGDTVINPHHHLNRKQLDVRGCFGFEFRHFYRATQALASIARRFPWQRLVTREYPLESAAQALEDVAQMRVVKALIRPSRTL